MTSPIALTSSAPGHGGLSTPDQGAGGGAGQGRPRMEKASLILYDLTPARGGGGKQGEERGRVPFQFNPKEVTISKSAKWERKTAKGAQKAGAPEFTGPEPCKMTLEMFFDATGDQPGSVVGAVEQLLACCVPTAESIQRKKQSPPLVVLHWGSTSSFPAFVTSVSAKYTLFAGDGTPVRATCSVALEEMPNEAERQNPTSGGRAARRAHRTVAGDTLASVAFAEYGDPTRWRALAAYNGIDDPLRLAVGSTLLVPAPEELVVRS